ncbi:MAG TPA: hypothetical protein GXX36_08035 [Clostridiaceae bacterium]|nr:hypothetical protein [Clostridiaceae bacterium]
MKLDILEKYTNYRLITGGVYCYIKLLYKEEDNTEAGICTIADLNYCDHSETDIYTLMATEDNQPYDIGVFYFSNWNPELSSYMIANIRNIYGRRDDMFGGIKETLLTPGLWGYGPIPDREPTENH